MNTEEREDIRRLDAEERAAADWLAGIDREEREARFAEGQAIASRAEASEREEIEGLIAAVESRHAAENVTAARLGLEATAEEQALAILEVFYQKPYLARVLSRILRAAEKGDCCVRDHQYGIVADDR